MSVKIEISERLGDWWIDKDGEERPKLHAQIEGEPGVWSCGRTTDEAIGDLVRSHPERFNVKIDYLGRQPR